MTDNTSTSPIPNLDDTVTQLNLDTQTTDNKAKGKRPKTSKSGKRRPSARTPTKRGALLAAPSRTIDDAIADGAPPKELDALLKEWSEYNTQQALLRAKTETEALANAIEARRRAIADELLKLADGYGISMGEARKIFDEARQAQRSGKLK